MYQYHSCHSNSSYKVFCLARICNLFPFPMVHQRKTEFTSSLKLILAKVFSLCLSNDTWSTSVAMTEAGIWNNICIISSVATEKVGRMLPKPNRDINIEIWCACVPIHLCGASCYDFIWKVMDSVWSVDEAKNQCKKFYIEYTINKKIHQ